MPSRGNVVITCGPAYEPIDEVRRITNHSTGELGIALANRLAADGWDVHCFIGAAATCRTALAEGVHRIRFTTNEDLLRRLGDLPQREEVKAFFHAAALCDFRVKQVLSATGAPLATAKIPSRGGEISLVLEPAPKVIAELRLLFPHSRIVGWKYELTGTPEEVWEKGARQIAENRTDLCIVNGAAYGLGFGILEPGGAREEVRGKEALGDWLAGWVGKGR
jgi:phosphopantothenoylcysteine synthetase/decarboxylase